MADARTLARGVLTVTSTRILGLVFTLVQVKLTVSHLGAHDYGLLVTVTLFITFFGAWTEFGLGTVVVRRVAGGGADLERQVGLHMAVALLVMAPMVAIVIASAAALYSHRPIVVGGIAVLTLGMLATTWASCFQPIAQVKSKFGYYAAADLVGRVLSLSIVITALVVDGGLWWFFLAQLMIPTGTLVAMVLLGRSVGRFGPVFDWRGIGGLIRETLPLSYILIIGVLYYTIDGILLSKLAPPAEVGGYGFAYRLVGTATIIASSMSAVLTAQFSADANKEGDAFASIVSRALTVIVVMAAALAVLVGPIAEGLIRFAGSPDMVTYAKAPLSLLAVAVAIGMVSSILSTAAITDHRQQMLTVLNTVNLVINVVLNLLLIPPLHATGAAIALVISEFTGMVVVTVILARHRPGLIPWRTVALLPIPSAAAWMLGTALPAAWPVRALVALIAYAGLVLAVRITTIEQLRSLFRRPAPEQTAVG